MSVEIQSLIRVAPKELSKVEKTEDQALASLRKTAGGLLPEYQQKGGDASQVELKFFLEDIEDLAALDGPNQPKYAQTFATFGSDEIVRYAFTTRLMKSQAEFESAKDNPDVAVREKATTDFQRDLGLALLLRLDSDAGRDDYKGNAESITDLIKEHLTQEPVAAPDIEAAAKSATLAAARLGSAIHAIGEPQEPAPIPSPEEPQTIEKEVITPVVQVGGYTEGKSYDPKKDRADSRNEDSMFVEMVDEERVIAGVFDGLGGRADGRIASQKAKEVVREIMRERTKTGGISRTALRDEVFPQAEAAIMALKDGKEDGASTTATVVEIRHLEDGVYSGVWASVGDSRAYILDGKTGRLRQLSKDHSVVSDDVDEDDEPISGEAMYNFQGYRATEENGGVRGSIESHYYRYRYMVTDFLGTNEKPRDRFTNSGFFEAHAGDSVWLFTDGVTDSFNRRQLEQKIKTGLAKGLSPTQISRSIVNDVRNDFKEYSRWNKPSRFQKVQNRLPGQKPHDNLRTKRPTDDATAEGILLGSKITKEKVTVEAIPPVIDADPENDAPKVMTYADVSRILYDQVGTGAATDWAAAFPALERIIPDALNQYADLQPAERANIGPRITRLLANVRNKPADREAFLQYCQELVDQATTASNQDRVGAVLSTMQFVLAPAEYAGFIARNPGLHETSQPPASDIATLTLEQQERAERALSESEEVARRGSQLVAYFMSKGRLSEEEALGLLALGATDEDSYNKIVDQLEVDYAARKRQEVQNPEEVAGLFNQLREGRELQSGANSQDRARGFQLVEELQIQLSQALNLSPEDSYLPEAEEGIIQQELVPDVGNNNQILAYMRTPEQAELAREMFAQGPPELKEAFERFQEAYTQGIQQGGNPSSLIAETPDPAMTEAQQAINTLQHLIYQVADYDRSTWSGGLGTNIIFQEAKTFWPAIKEGASNEDLIQAFVTRNRERRQTLEASRRENNKLRDFINGLAEKANFELKVVRDEQSTIPAYHYEIVRKEVGTPLDANTPEPPPVPKRESLKERLAREAAERRAQGLSDD